MLYEQLSGEFLDHSAFAVVLNKGIMLFGCAFREGLEPVGVVGDTILVGPLLHAFCHSVGNAAVQRGTVVDNVDEFLVDICGKILVHLSPIEHFLSEVLRGALQRGDHLNGLSGRCLFDGIKS